MVVIAGLHGITWRRNEGSEQGFHVKLDCKSRAKCGGLMVGFRFSSVFRKLVQIVGG